MADRDKAVKQVKRVEANIIAQQQAQYRGGQVSSEELRKLCRELGSMLGHPVTPADIKVSVQETEAWRY